MGPGSPGAAEAEGGTGAAGGGEVGASVLADTHPASTAVSSTPPRLFSFVIRIFRKPGRPQA
jgi:hypothetical protein